MTATYKMATKHQQVAKDIVRAAEFYHCRNNRRKCPDCQSCANCPAYI